MIDGKIKVGDKYIDGYGDIITITPIGNPKEDFPTLRNKVGEYYNKQGNPHQCYYTYEGIS